MNWSPPRPPGPAALLGRYARLDRLRADHAGALHAAFSEDPGVWDHLPYGPFETAEEYAAWIDAWPGRDPLFYAITDLEADRACGVASYLNIVPAHGTIEVGHLCFAPCLQRRRAATEAVALMASWAFTTGYRRLEWKCNARNLRSRRAAERLGFSYEGVFRRHMIQKGRNRDTAWFAMTDEEWPRIAAAHAAWLDPANFDAAGAQLGPLGALTTPCRVACDPGL